MSSKTYFFCGIGGSGMSAMAQVVNAWGHRVIGSDRDRDTGRNERLFDQLTAQGIQLVPQDGQSVDSSIDEFIVSSAVEERIPDVRAAREHGVTIRKRAELLAELFNTHPGIAVGGTSGKTTVTAMIGHILNTLQQQPTVINGGLMLNAVAPPLLGNAICGDRKLPVVETDESDGTNVLFRPQIGVLTNITEDHKPMAELLDLFQQFVDGTQRAVIRNAECPHSSRLTGAGHKTFAIDSEADYRAEQLQLQVTGSTFTINGHPAALQTPGRHNVANAVAAVAACHEWGMPLADCVKALTSFRGVARRLQPIGEANGIAVLDDFAHNPDKIKATLNTMTLDNRRVIALFQSHGYGPTRFLWDGLVDVFSNSLRANDQVILTDIYDAGGTADRSVSITDLATAINARGTATAHLNREASLEWLRVHAKPGDVIVSMGARDPSLPDFAARILAALG